MAYDATKPADDEYLSAFPAEMREQLRAIIQDAIVNALTVNGYSPGNLNGNIPVSNGNLNANLNADKLDGHDATYFSANGHVHAAATQSTDGFMSNTDKTKLDNIAWGAEVNQNTFSNVAVGAITLQADNKTDTLTLAAGANIAITPDATNDKVTIAVTGTVPAAENASHAVNATNATNATNAVSAAAVNATVPTGQTKDLVSAGMTGDDRFRIRVGDTGYDQGYVSFDTGDGASEPIYFRQYNWDNVTPGTFATLIRQVTLLDGNGNTTFPGTVSAPTFSGHLAGTADTANRLTYSVAPHFVTIQSDTDNLWQSSIGPNSGFWLTSLRTGLYAPSWIVGNFAAGIAFGGEDTKGVLSLAYEKPYMRFAGGNADQPSWIMSAYGSPGATYNLDNMPKAQQADNSSTLNGYTAAQLIGETSHATNGYHKFPDGTIIQWGYAAANGSYLFPIAFPNACLNVSLTVFAPTLDGGGDNGPVVLRSQSTTGFTYWDTDDYNNYPVSYIAIGY